MGRAAGASEASAQARAARARSLRASADLRRDLRRAYARLYFAQEAREAAERVLELRRRYAELVSLKYDSGRESKGNRLRAQAQLAAAQVEAAKAARGLSVARRQLSRRLGGGPRGESLRALPVAAAEPPEEPADPAGLAALRPELSEARAEAEAAAARRLAARSAFWPALGLSYSRSRTGPAELPAARYAWSAGASLSYPLFGSGPTAAFHSEAAARSRAKAAESQLEAARQEAVLAVESAWASYADAVGEARAAEAQLEAARQRGEEADVRYAAGLLGFDLWEPIVSERLSRERSVIESRRAAADAQTDWERALGRALGE